jgi:hypothetical protein
VDDPESGALPASCDVCALSAFVVRRRLIQTQSNMRDLPGRQCRLSAPPGSGVAPPAPSTRWSAQHGAGVVKIRA